MVVPSHSFGASYAGRYLFGIPSFAIEFSRHSPGEVLLRQLILAAIEEGAESFRLWNRRRGLQVPLCHARRTTHHVERLSEVVALFAEATAMKRVMVISPHPDDEAIGCGGAICGHIASGDTVYLELLTSGEKGGAIR